MAYLGIGDIMEDMRKYLKFKGVMVNPFGFPVLGSGRNIASKSKKREKGRRYFQYQCFTHNFKNTAPKNLIVMYDIPSSKKKEREWYRRQLQKFDYIMIQKSVWVGPSPLPNDFLKYIKSIGLLNQIKTLKLAKPYSRGESNM